MGFVGYINTSENETRYGLLTADPNCNDSNRGYCITNQSKQLLNAIHAGTVINSIQYTRSKTMHGLIIPVHIYKRFELTFLNERFCVGVKKDIREDIQTTDNFTVFDDMSWVKIDHTNKNNSTLIKSAPDATVMTGPTAVKIVNAIMKSENMKLNDILIWDAVLLKPWKVIAV